MRASADETEARRAITLGRAVAATAIALVVGIGLGWLARSSFGAYRTPTGPPRSPGSVADVADPASTRAGAPRGDESAASGLFEAWGQNMLLAAKLGELEDRLAEMKARGERLEDVVSGLLSDMSDREIEAAIRFATPLGDELEEVKDMRAYAVRLTTIALEGTLGPEGGADPVATVTFTDSRMGVRDAGAARDRFEPNAKPIFAVFDTDGYGLEEVMIKWYRTDVPEILLFRRHDIVIDRALNFVWLAPRDGWQPGSYQVDLYRAEEGLGRLASGRYSVE
jgi:hypothetical protein